jgi:hypothetical protein
LPKQQHIQRKFDQPVLAGLTSSPEISIGQLPAAYQPVVILPRAAGSDPKLPLRLELINQFVQQTALIGSVCVAFQLVNSMTDKIVFPRVPD